MDNPSKDSFKDRAPPDLTKYDGMRVEGLNRNGKVQFRAELSVPAEDDAELIWLSRNKPPKRGPYHVYLRGYDQSSRREVYFEGSIRWIEDDYWELNNLVMEEPEREFFRVNTNFPAVATLLNRRSFKAECELLNISAGGVRIETRVKYWIKDRLRLEVPQLSEQGIPPLHCQVCRVYESEIPGVYGYGCQFIDLDVYQRDRVMGVVMSLGRWKPENET